MDMRGQEAANVIPMHGRGSISKAEMIASIQEFCMKRNFEDALSREEIGRLEKFDRVDAQRKSLLINMSHYYRDNPRADVAPGVLTIITLMSDNDKGACTMSQAQMAIILYRQRTTIAEAVTRLKASQVVRSVNGKAMSYPTIPRSVTQSYNHVVWVAEALKTVATCPVEPTGQNLSRGADSSNIPVPSKQQVALPTCRVEASEPVGSTGHNFTKENSLEERGKAPSGVMGKVAAVVAAGLAGMPMAAAAEPHPVERVMQGAAECWQTPKAQMAAALNINELRAQKLVWMTETGLLQVSASLKEELQHDFPLVDLTSGLAIAAATVHIDQGALMAIREIRKRFAYLQSDLAAKQKRAESYARQDDSSRAKQRKVLL
jgi:hypothetical protein